MNNNKEIFDLFMKDVILPLFTDLNLQPLTFNNFVRFEATRFYSKDEVPTTSFYKTLSLNKLLEKSLENAKLTINSNCFFTTVVLEGLFNSLNNKDYSNDIKIQFGSFPLIEFNHHKIDYGYFQEVFNSNYYFFKNYGNEFQKACSFPLNLSFEIKSLNNISVEDEIFSYHIKEIPFYFNYKKMKMNNRTADYFLKLLNVIGTKSYGFENLTIYKDGTFIFENKTYSNKDIIKKIFNCLKLSKEVDHFEIIIHGYILDRYYLKCYNKKNEILNWQTPLYPERKY